MESKVGRVFQHFSIGKLFRLKFFLFLCKSHFFIKNMRKFYFYSHKIIGKDFTHLFIRKLYGDLFVGGEDFVDLEKSLEEQKKEGLFSIADYAREFLHAHEEVDIDKIIDSYKKSIDIAVKVDPNNKIAIKVSSLCELEKLKTFNKIQAILNEIEICLVQDNKTEEQIVESVFIY